MESGPIPSFEISYYSDGLLANSIKRFMAGDALIEQGAGVALAPMQVRKIVPVLVHLDTALRTYGIPGYMTKRFKSLCRVKQCTLTPLVLIPIAELEEVEGYLEEFGLCAILESFLGALRANSREVFLTESLPILRGKPQKAGSTLRRFDSFIDGMMSRLFPAEFRKGDLQNDN